MKAAFELKDMLKKYIPGNRLSTVEYNVEQYEYNVEHDGME